MWPIHFDMIVFIPFIILYIVFVLIHALLLYIYSRFCLRLPISLSKLNNPDTWIKLFYHDQSIIGIKYIPALTGLFLNSLKYAFIICAAICACLYFLFLCVMVFRVFWNIRGKRAAIPTMSRARQLQYQVRFRRCPQVYLLEGTR